MKTQIWNLVALLCLGLVGSFTQIAYADGFFEDTSAQFESLADRPKPPVGLIFDEHSSANVGSEGLQFLLRGYQHLDDYLFLNTEGDTQFAMVLGRFCKLVVEDLIFSTGVTAQHEIFGHGARAREFHLPIERYEIRPYHGSTSYNTAKFNQLSFSEEIAFAAGGIEATGILAQGIRNRWLQGCVMDEREAHLYILSTIDQTGYILSTKRRTIFPKGHDILGYVQLVNAWYGRPLLTTSKLRSKTLVDFLDPFFFYSLYSTLGNYLNPGK